MLISEADFEKICVIAEPLPAKVREKLLSETILDPKFVDK